MTLTELKYLIAVADEQHFGRAAERSFVSQPSLSAAIKNIEQELGVRVFERSKRGVELTEVGAEVVAQARRTLEEAARIKSVAKQGKGRFRLRLGVIHTVAPYLLPQLVVALRKSAPEMSLDIEENMTANLDRLLKSGELDAVILALPYEAPGIEVEPIYDEEFEVVVPQGHALARRRTVPVDELDAGELLLLPVGHCFRDQVLGACTEFSRPPPPGRIGQFARDAAQHGGVEARRDGVAENRAHRASRHAARESCAVCGAAAEAAHRGRVAQDGRGAGAAERRAQAHRSSPERGPARRATRRRGVAVPREP